MADSSSARNGDTILGQRLRAWIRTSLAGVGFLGLLVPFWLSLVMGTVDVLPPAGTIAISLALPLVAASLAIHYVRHTSYSLGRFAAFVSLSLLLFAPGYVMSTRVVAPLLPSIFVTFGVVGRFLPALLAYPVAYLVVFRHRAAIRSRLT